MNVSSTTVYATKTTKVNVIADRQDKEISLMDTVGGRYSIRYETIKRRCDLGGNVGV